ncbi:MAG: transcription-repair coupling factor, partial [Alistipes sp.]|nr:transcription-repair coupling factor [Candidatus Minthomonas equi]
MLPEKGKLLTGNQNFTRLAELLDDSESGNLLVTGLFASARSYALAAGIVRGCHLVIFPDRDSAVECVSDLYVLTGEKDVFFFPAEDSKSTAKSVKSATVQVQRTAALGALSSFVGGEYDGEFVIVVSYPDALKAEVPTDRAIGSNTYTVTKGEKISFDFLKEMLFSLGFERVDYVSQPGEFAVRGGLVDVFSYSDDKPCRIDFFGDEVESIRMFDVNTQRSFGSIDAVTVFPNLSGRDAERIPFMEFFPQDGTVWMCDSDDVSKVEGMHRKICLSQSARGFRYDQRVDFNTAPQPSFNKNFDLLSENLRDYKALGYEIHVMSESISQIERLKSIFTTHDIKVCFETYTIQSGFIDNDARICLYTDHQIFERYRYVKLRRTIERSERISMDEINALREGDFIVHIDHGVGRFGGLVKNVVNGRQQEAVKLIYKDGDILFVSLHSLHKISKYRSADSGEPKIYKLGTGAWSNLKNKTKSKVRDIAADLVKLYSERRVADGFAFSQDSYLMHELESNFMYEDTPDQHRAIELVKGDMEKNYPMDRLICGDVGFG